MADKEPIVVRAAFCTVSLQLIRCARLRLPKPVGGWRFRGNPAQIHAVLSVADQVAQFNLPPDANQAILNVELAWEREMMIDPSAPKDVLLLVGDDGTVLAEIRELAIPVGFY